MAPTSIQSMAEIIVLCVIVGFGFGVLFTTSIYDGILKVERRNHEKRLNNYREMLHEARFRDFSM